METKQKKEALVNADVPTCAGKMSREFMEKRIQEMIKSASYQKLEFVYWLLAKEK